jgi:hypothetical protein
MVIRKEAPAQLSAALFFATCTNLNQAFLLDFKGA